MAGRMLLKKAREMSVKQACTIMLLLFVAASIVTLAVKSLRQEGPAAPVEEQADRLIVYYFHGAFRCPKCRSIETYAHEAIAGPFKAEVAIGRIKWEVVDYERPGNKHFAKDFALVAPTVVLVEMRGGTQKRWKNLTEVWELVDDKPAFVAFIRKEVQVFLDEK